MVNRYQRSNVKHGWYEWWGTRIPKSQLLLWDGREQQEGPADRVVDKPLATPGVLDWRRALVST